MATLNRAENTNHSEERMRSAHLTIVVSLLAMVMQATAANAQVGLQVRNGALWGSVVDLSAAGPVSLRWKWDGVGTPSRAVWQISTSTTTTTSRDGNPEGVLSIPTTTGVYQPFSVTVPSRMRLPVYIRVRVDNAGKSAYSRWITVRPVTTTTGATGATATTSGTTPTPLPGSTQLVPIKVTLTGIEAIRTARIDYNKYTNADGESVTTDDLYLIAVAIDLKWTDIKESKVKLSRITDVRMTSGQTKSLSRPVWGPYGEGYPIQGQGLDAMMMFAVMHRYGSTSFGTVEAAVLSEVRDELKGLELMLPKLTKEAVRLQLVASFRRGLQNAFDGQTPDRPVEVGSDGWVELVGGAPSTIGQELTNARNGVSTGYSLTFGSDANPGGHFRLRLVFHK
jgi:hypothetical protein